MPPTDGSSPTRNAPGADGPGRTNGNDSAASVTGSTSLKAGSSVRSLPDPHQRYATTTVPAAARSRAPEDPPQHPLDTKRIRSGAVPPLRCCTKPWNRYLPRRTGSSTPQLCPDALVAELLVTFQRADVGGHQRLDAVAEAARGLTERYARAEPRCSSRVAAVVDAQARLADRLQGPVPGSTPVRRARPGALARAEQQVVGRPQVVALDPLPQHVDEHRRDRHAAWAGLGLARFVQRDVGLSYVDPAPPLLGKGQRSRPQHHDPVSYTHLT